jgi:hypothetical protein
LDDDLMRTSAAVTAKERCKFGMEENDCRSSPAWSLGPSSAPKTGRAAQLRPGARSSNATTSTASSVGDLRAAATFSRGKNQKEYMIDKTRIFAVTLWTTYIGSKKA